VPKKPIIAIMYDFDKTLCTKDMQEYSFIPNMGMSASDFWKETTQLCLSEKMDRILTYMYMMIDKSNLNHKSIKREDFVKLGKHIEYFHGVETWFERINKFGKENGLIIEHYIISSGLKEIIEGCSIGKYFKKIYACEFYYNHNGIAVWPKMAVNYTAKTQFLFRINKGVLDISNDDDLNRYKPLEDREIPFRNMIYIGDGLTDVPCMKLVKVNGGNSISVYRSSMKKIANELIKSERVDYITKADYAENSELEQIVKNIIVMVSAIERLFSIHKKHMKATEKKKVKKMN
jgi:hypothetical protein